MNEKQTERVWSRVMCAQAGDAPDVLPPQEPGSGGVLTEGRLLELVSAEHSSALTYRALAGMACGCARTQLLQLAEQERCHSRKLAALYFLRTGRKACPEPGRKPCVACLTEALRERWHAEQEDAKLYRTLSGGPDAELFRCLAEQEAQHACRLLGVLECTL